MVLNDVLEVVQLLLGVLLAEVFVVEVSFGYLLGRPVAIIDGDVTAIINKGRVVAQFGSLSVTGAALFPFSTSTALSFEILSINGNGPE